MNKDRLIKIEEDVILLELYTKQVKKEAEALQKQLKEEAYMYSSKHRATMKRRTLDIKNLCTKIKHDLY